MPSDTEQIPSNLGPRHHTLPISLKETDTSALLDACDSSLKRETIDLPTLAMSQDSPSETRHGKAQAERTVAKTNGKEAERLTDNEDRRYPRDDGGDPSLAISMAKLVSMLTPMVDNPPLLHRPQDQANVSFTPEQLIEAARLLQNIGGLPDNRYSAAMNGDYGAQAQRGDGGPPRDSHGTGPQDKHRGGRRFTRETDSWNIKWSSIRGHFWFLLRWTCIILTFPILLWLCANFAAYIVLPQLENTTNDIGTGIRAWKESIGRAACEVPLVGWWHPKCKLLEDPSASKTDSAFEVFDVVFRPSLGNSATFTALAQNMEKIGLATQALADVVDGSELPRKDKLVSWLEQFAAEAEATNLALLKFDSDLRLAFGYISSRNQIARETIQQARDDERTLLAKVSSVWRRGRGEKLERLVTELLEDTARRFNDQFERLSEQALNTDARLVRLNVMSDKIRSTAQQDRGSLEKSVSSESVLISLWKRYGRGKSTYKENLTVLDSLKRHRKETRARVSDALRSLRNDKRQVEKMVFISSPGELDKERAYAEKYWDSFVRKEFEDYRDGREQGLSS